MCTIEQEVTNIRLEYMIILQEKIRLRRCNWKIHPLGQARNHRSAQSFVGNGPSLVLLQPSVNASVRQR